MTVRIHTTLLGINQEQFEAIHKLIMAGESPNGLLFHSSAPIEGGWQVADFWESRQAYDAAMGPPSVEEFAVHEIFRP
jgi:hypothetical protein